MSVTIEAHVDAEEFEFGRVIESIDGVRIELETIIPIGEQALSLIEVHDENRRVFVEELREHSAVAAVVAVEEHDDLGISDQAVVERLRRATVTLARDRL